MSEQALTCATRFGDPDLMSFALVSIGESLIRLGRTGEGVRLLDEAMAGVTAGEVSPVVSGLAYCAVIAACHEAFDLRRAREWTAELSRWCSAQEQPVPYRGVCLAHRVEIMCLHGDWEDALDEAREACRSARSGPTARSADAAFYQLGELHRLRGEHDEAERAYREASRLGHTAQPGVALSLLATGSGQAAERAIRTALDAAGDRTARCRILPAYVDVMLAAVKVDEARTAAEELAVAAEALDSPLLDAISGRAKGAVLLAAGEARGAQAVLGHAVAVFRDLGAPYDVARTRLLIGLACRETGDEVTARLEIEAATSAFRELGAAPDLARGEALALTATTRAAGLLTAREREVLAARGRGEVEPGRGGRPVPEREDGRPSPRQHLHQARGVVAFRGDGVRPPARASSDSLAGPPAPGSLVPPSSFRRPRSGALVPVPRKNHPRSGVDVLRTRRPQPGA